MKKSSLTLAVVASLLIVSTGRPEEATKKDDNKIEPKAEGKLEPKIGEKGKVGVSMDVQGKKELSVGYGPAGVKLTEEGVEGELGYEKKIGDVEAAAKVSIKGSVDRAEKTDFYPEGVPSLKLTGAVGVEATTGAGAAKVSVGASKNVFSVKADPLNFRGTNDRLAQTLKAADSDTEVQASQNQPPAAAPYKPKTMQEVMAEHDRLEAEMKKLGLTKAKAGAPADAPPAPAGTPMASASPGLSNGWLIFHRPANIDSGTWALYLDAFKKEFSTKPWIREIKENGEELRLRFEGQSDADLDASSQGSESYLTILRDPKTSATNPSKPVVQATTSQPGASPAPSPATQSSGSDGHITIIRPANVDDQTWTLRAAGIATHLLLNYGSVTNPKISSDGGYGYNYTGLTPAEISDIKSRFPGIVSFDSGGAPPSAPAEKSAKSTASPKREPPHDTHDSQAAKSANKFAQSKIAATPGYWYDPDDNEAKGADPVIYVRVDGEAIRVRLSEAQGYGVPEDATKETMTWYSARTGKITKNKEAHTNRGN